MWFGMLWWVHVTVIVMVKCCGARSWMDVDVYHIKLANLLVTRALTYSGTVRVEDPLVL
jgi:hypothetical protein